MGSVQPCARALAAVHVQARCHAALHCPALPPCSALAAKIAALGITDAKLSSTEKEAKRRASIRLMSQAMSFEQKDIDTGVKRMMKSALAASVRLQSALRRFASVAPRHAGPSTFEQAAS